jgi:uncharacterized protein (DUF305 family)
MVLHRFGWWIVVALLAAGCAAPRSHAPVATDQTDVWFLQHTVPHLRQTTAVVSLTREHLTDPGLARLADTIARRSQANIDQLQRWLDQRGLSPHGHSHQRVDIRRQTDLERLARLRGSALNLAFVQVMTARSRTTSKLAGNEARDGSLPDIRQFARQLLASQQVQVRQLKSWRQARWIRRTSRERRRMVPRRLEEQRAACSSGCWLGVDRLG